VRWFLLTITLGLLTVRALADGEAHVVQKFNGTDLDTSTATFTVQDKWEVFWFFPMPVNITLLTADGTVVSGYHGAGRGSCYQPKGGTFYLQINSASPSTIKIPWECVVAEVGSGTTLNRDDVGPMLGVPSRSNYAPPDTVLPPGSVQPTPESTTNTTFNPAAPGTNADGTPATPPPPSQPAPLVKLTEDQARAVVLIKGDNAEGTGFLIKTMDGPAVVTNLHVIGNNPNLKITTNTGALITVLSTKGASDRDMALLAIQDQGYSYLDMATEISRVAQPGDDIITPGNSEGGEVMLNTGGKILGIGPDRIEIDNPIYHGNSGGPIFHVKSGKVLGVVTEAMKVVNADDLDKASFASRNSAISGSMRYFGLRMDTVSEWIPIEARRFAIETAFLDQFHQQSLRIDSYLNGNSQNQGGDASADGSSGSDAAKLYLTDDKIMKANARFLEQVSGADTEQRIDALRGLAFDLQGIVDLDVDQIKNPNNFYPFDLERAREELAYRNALKTELDSIGNDIQRLGSLPRTNN
jgi:hypothetical protein